MSSCIGINKTTTSMNRLSSIRIILFAGLLAFSALSFADARLTATSSSLSASNDRRQLDQYYNFEDEETEGSEGDWGDYEGDPLDPNPSSFPYDEGDDSPSREKEGDGKDAHSSTGRSSISAEGKATTTTASASASSNYAGGSSGNASTSSSAGGSKRTSSGGYSASTSSSSTSQSSGGHGAYSSAASTSSTGGSKSTSMAGYSSSTSSTSSSSSKPSGGHEPYSTGSNSYSGGTGTSSGTYTGSSSSHSSRIDPYDYGGYGVGGQKKSSFAIPSLDFKKAMSVKVPLIPALFLFALCAYLLMLLTAFSFQNNPEGVFTNCCRLSVHTASCIFKVYVVPTASTAFASNLLFVQDQLTLYSAAPTISITADSEKFLQ